MENNATMIAVIQLLLTVTAAAIAIIPPLLKMRSDKKKAEAEADSVQVASAMEMVAKWEGRVQALEQRIIALEFSEEYWKRGCYLLLNQLAREGIIPCWEPNGGSTKRKKED